MMRWSPEEEKEYLRRQKKRNVAIAIVLAAFALLFYGITVARMHG